MENRSYSLNSRTTSADVDTNTPGCSTWINARARSSFLGVRIRMEKADGHCLDSIPFYPVKKRLEFGGRHGLSDTAAREGPFIHLQSKGAGNQRRRLMVIQTIEDHPVGQPELQNVSESLGGQDCRPGALSFQKGVRRNRCSVSETRNGGGIGAGLVQSLQDPLGPNRFGPWVSSRNAACG